MSKNDIGARKTPVMACVSMPLLAFVPKMDREDMKANVKRACMAPRPA